MKDWLTELLALLHEFEEKEGVKFQPGRDVNLVTTDDSHDTHTKTGREKYTLKRKAKRLNRLIERAQREGYDLAELLREQNNKPHVTSREQDGGWKIVVDEAGVQADADEDSFTIKTDQFKEEVIVPFDIGAVERNENLGMTVFVLHPQTE